MNENYFLVEQAVFLTNLTRRSADGRNEAFLLAATDRASLADLNAALERASRVETFDAGYDSRNLFFFPTSSGAFAVGRLTPAAPEEGEGAFYFQTFFVEEETFFQCGANPVALLHLALNTAKFSLYRPGTTLEAFRLEARAPWIDREDLRRTTERLGTRALTTLIQTVLESRRTAFVSDYNAFLVVAALFELTPIHWRPELTFAVGVRFRDDSSFRLVGATARRGVEGPNFETGAEPCDLREVVENDDAYPIENAWAALVESALKGNRVDYLYERMAEEFFLYQKARDDDGLGASSDEVAELGLRWRPGLERAVRGEDGGDEASDPNAENDFDDEATGEEESFFDGEFEGGWRDSDGDEHWRVDGLGSAAEERPTPPVERVAPEFVYDVVEPTEAERVEAANDREKGRENDAARKKTDNNDGADNSDGEKARNGDGEKKRRLSVFDNILLILSDPSFEDEWAAIQGERDENAPAKPEKPVVEKKRNDKKKEKEEVGKDSAAERERKKRKKKAAIEEALGRILGGKNGVVGSEGKGRRAIVGECEDLMKVIAAEPTFDDALGLDGLKNLDALLGERGAEALERLSRSPRRVLDERRTTDRDARRLRLAPFAALSAEFPGWNEELRRFDALFDLACAGNATAAKELRDFWRRWRRQLEDETVDRIRGAYEERLRGRLTGLDGGAVERTERLLTALEIYGALFLES